VSWWGKVLGGAFGFLAGGPLGALIGAAIGHGFDRGLREQARLEGEGPSHQERAQTAFFTATFSVMGHLAKADGRVGPEEIRVASRLMDRMGLEPGLKRAARELFRQGKAPDFPLDGVLAQFRRECGPARDLFRVFLEVQMEAAWADGAVDAREQRILRRIAAHLGFEEAELASIEHLVRMSMAHARSGGGPGWAGGRRAGGGSGPGPSRPARSLEEAYAALGVRRDAPDEEVTRAYRRMVSRHHPDKLVSKGLPDEMIQIATRRTAEIRAAYERIREARGR
jgi:DnaJ like chaperone protein